MFTVLLKCMIPQSISTSFIENDPMNPEHDIEEKTRRAIVH